MNYAFPVIEHIDQVRNAIKGRNSFYESARDGIIIFNYMFNTPDTFPDVTNEDEAILRECRGLIFHANGTLASRRLHKFFNVNEKEEVKLENIDFTQPHIIIDKLDGSMITPLLLHINGVQCLRWATKMGLTDVALLAEEFVKDKQNYVDFATALIFNGFTPIFEFCSRKQRIVIEYENDQLILIAIRNNSTGKYMSYDEMKDLAIEFNVECVVAFDRQHGLNPQSIIDTTKNLIGLEGYVIRFDNGHMLKIKSDWYVQIHRAKEAINLEKNVLVSIVDGTIDDLKPILQENDRKRLEQYESIVCDSISYLARKIDNDLTILPIILNGDRKRFAIEYAANMDAVSRSIMFKLWDNADKIENRYSLIYSMIVDNIRNACKTIAGVDKVRFAIGNAKWSEINV